MSGSLPKLNLIYIASLGRSGSTLLEMMLGAHSQVATCGELHIWPHELLAQDRQIPCACGEPILSCPFWLRMQQQVNPLTDPPPRLHHFREHHDAGKTLRLSLLADLTQPGIPPRLSEAIQTYGENNYRILSTFQTEISAATAKSVNWVVDASKDPYRLWWLLKSDRFNIKVLHVVKDPRAYVYAVSKPYFPEAHPLRLLVRTVRKTLVWVTQNALFSQIAQHHIPAGSYQVVPYEALATDPDGVFESICQFIGLPYETTAVAHFRQGAVHTIAGNPMRFREGGIVLDEKWKQVMPDPYQRLSALVAGSSLSFYGYSGS